MSDMMIELIESLVPDHVERVEKHKNLYRDKTTGYIFDAKNVFMAPLDTAEVRVHDGYETRGVFARLSPNAGKQVILICTFGIGMSTVYTAAQQKG